MSRRLGDLLAGSGFVARRRGRNGPYVLDVDPGEGGGGGAPAWSAITGKPAGVTAAEASTAFARTLWDDADAAAARATLELGTAATSAATAFANAPSVAAVASNVENSTTTLQNVTGLTFSATANSTYSLEVFGSYQTAATTTGIGLAITVPAGATLNGYGLIRQAADGVDSLFEGQFLVAGTAIVSASVVAINTSYGFYLRALVANGVTAGSVNIQHRSEVAASIARVMAGTRMIWQRVA